MPDYNYRIHPAFAIARVGTSEEYYVEPDTPAGLPKWNVAGAGGLPTDPATGATITSTGLRDANRNFKRQAARFKIYQYEEQAVESYPNGGGTEITIGSVVDGKTVADIIWTVHPANKKTNTFVMVESSDGDAGFHQYLNDKLPPIRNPQEPPVINDPTEAQKIQILNDPDRVRKLTIDPGPRTINGKDSAPVRFDRGTTASYWESGTASTPIVDYPKSFPNDSFSHLDSHGEAIDTLGQLLTDGDGRLLVLGGYGRAAAWQDAAGRPFPLIDDVNNNGWFDDTSDGPVSAVLVFEDNTVQPVQGGAWVTATDPAYAPQTLNAVSLWEDIYDVWVRNLGLVPGLYDQGSFNDNYVPSFDAQFNQIFQAAALQRWNTAIPNFAVTFHDQVAENTAATDPTQTPLGSGGTLQRIRGEDNRGDGDVNLMPLSLGDANEHLLAMRPTQFYLLSQWVAKWQTWRNDPTFTAPYDSLGPGEKLDKVVLQNCLAGRFSPGIDATFVVRIPEIYIQDWQTSGGGPFRVKPKPLDYSAAQSAQPFLTQGYVPLRGDAGLEPGDVSKLMAIPWHTDYNSCSLHRPSPPIANSTTLFWSWPAQRPVSVYPARDNPDGNPIVTRYSVRGEGTYTANSDSLGIFQERIAMVENWHKIGVIIQGTAIDYDGANFSGSVYFEVESQLGNGGNVVDPYPIQSETPTKRADC